MTAEATFDFNGKSLKINGITARTIEERISRGWPMERAITETPIKTFRTITHNGETLTLGEWAKRAGVTIHAFTARIDKLGWSMDKALSKPIVPLPRMEINKRRISGLRMSL